MKCPIEYTTAEIIHAQKVKGKNLKLLIDHVVETLCKCKAFTGMVFKHVLHNNGNKQDAENLIQESLLTLVRVLTSGRFKGNSSIENYTFGISKNLWRDKRKSYRSKNVKHNGVEVGKELVDSDTPQDFLEVKETRQLLWELINQLGETCKEVLKLWSLNYPHKEIAKKFNWDEGKSRKQTKSCKDKLRTLIKESNIRKQDLSNRNTD